MQPLGRAAEVQLFGQRQERLDLVPLQHAPSIVKHGFTIVAQALVDR
jgi:hypothetical protein